MSGFRPTIEDVAKAAGVSRATVSRVINNVPGASGAVRARVQQAVSELGYLPNQSARALASGRARAVDVVAVNYTAAGWLGTHPYYSRVLAGAMSVIEDADVQLRVHVLQNDEGAGEAIDAIAQGITVGALLATVTPELATRLHRRSRRVVSLVATAPRVPAFEADNDGGTYAAVEHLYRLGRRRIAAVHGPEGNTCAQDRRDGYRRAVRDLGLEEIGDGGDFLREDGYAAAQRLLERRPDIDAMFVACDLMGAGAVQAITASGRTVPLDVSVVGFDDSVAAVCANPPLSTMRMPVEEMAAEATRLLLEGTPDPGLRRRFPVQLVERQSTFR